MVRARLKAPNHALVVGSSIAGMLAAAGLARHARRVTVIERDALPADASGRKGVPQGAQAHLLLDRGRQAIAGLFPDLFDDLQVHGAERVDFGREFRWFHHGHWKISCDTPYELSVQTRPFLEHHMRRHLARLPNIEFRSQTEVMEPVVEDARVTAARLHDRNHNTSEIVACDMLVDASGRGARSREWLASLGYGDPPGLVTSVELCYAARMYRRPADAPADWRCCVVYGKRPADRRHGLVFPVEGDRWQFSFVGYEGDAPPCDPEGLEAFARGLARPDLYHLMRSAEPISEVRRHRFPRQRWIRYDKLPGLPGGYAVVGDAVCSLDPVFGQGITMAALEAELLARQLGRPKGFASTEFARACARKIANPWMMTSAEAFRYPSADGDRPLGLPIVHRLLDRVFERSATDPVVYRAFLEVMQLHRGPAALLRPSVLLRLARGARSISHPEHRSTHAREPTAYGPQTSRHR